MRVARARNKNGHHHLLLLVSALQSFDTITFTTHRTPTANSIKTATEDTNTLYNPRQFLTALPYISVKRSQNPHSSRQVTPTDHNATRHQEEIIIMTRNHKFWRSSASFSMRKLFVSSSLVVLLFLWQNLRLSTTSPYDDMGVQYIDGSSHVTFLPNLIHSSNSNKDNKPHRDLIVYLSQGPASSYAQLSQRFQSLPNALFYYHSYDQDCPGCIFQPNSTLPKGRNLVLKTAYNSLSHNNTLDQVKYFIMMDDDVEIQCVSSRRDCWMEYHYMLLDERITWPFLAPKYFVDADDEPTSYHTCRDDSLWVMKWDNVHFLYPFPTRHDTKSWHIYVQAAWERMKKCFPNGFLTHKGYRNYNPRHGDYPKGLRKRLVVDILNAEYPTLGPWSIQPSKGGIGFRCARALHKPPVQQQVDPKCAAVTRERFQKWIDGTFDP